MSGHRVEFGIFKSKIPQVLGRDWTTLRAANDEFSFDFKVQLQRYPLLIIPLIIPLNAPQVDRMDFLLVNYIFRCDPQRSNNLLAHHNLWMLVYWSLSFLFVVGVSMTCFHCLYLFLIVLS